MRRPAHLIALSACALAGVFALLAHAADAPKAEAPKADAPKADAPKADAPKADAPKADSPKADAPKADSLKMEAGSAAEPSKEGVEFFEKHIRPVLADKCYKCHSAKSEKVKGKLLLDTREGLLKGGENGAIVVPGNPEKSRLIVSLHYTDEDLQMPPKEQLPKETVQLFEQWVKMGAPDPRGGTSGAAAKYEPYDWAEQKKFWSFQPVHGPPAPAVKNAAGIVNPIDQFLQANYEAKGLHAVAPADRRALIRRATYDLTGLPPTPDEVDAFLADDSPSAFEKVVDRLLASPAYGERWGRHWLDLVRYADTSGCNSDFPIPQIYKYRDWVIRSFNEDKPYDQFVREQLAGDLLPSTDTADRSQKIIATGYLANARRFGSRASEFHQTIEDQIDNLGKVMLGLSVSCARCHDHKFDPIPNTDYYALYGIFNSAQYSFPGTEIYRHPKDLVPLGTPEECEKLLAYEQRVTELDNRFEQLTREMKTALKTPPKAKDVVADAKDGKDGRDSKNGKDSKDAKKPEAANAANAVVDDDDDAPKPAAKLVVKRPEPRPADQPPDAERPKPPVKDAPKRTVAEVKADMFEVQSELRRLEARPPDVEKAYAAFEGLPQDAKVQRKGDPKDLGDVVPRGFLTILGGQKLPPGYKSSGRLELAQWITDPTNPLFARVMANRIWQFHFGVGIVKTPNDFGHRGQPPTNPALLDYLATQFVKNGWSVKRMHRMLMLSRAYQMSDADDADDAKIDPGNEAVWRFNPRRLSAEEIRDTLLVLGNSLDRTPAGPHPFPPESEWKFSQHKQFVADYPTKHRSVYLMQQRIRRQPFLGVFDGADTNATTPDRPLSTTALQALFMMNDPFLYEQADKFAARIGLAFNDDPSRISYAYQIAYARPPTADETQAGLQYLREISQRLKDSGTPWDQLNRAALASYARVLMSSNEFVFLD